MAKAAYLYLFENSLGLYKIGYTADHPRKRLKTLQAQGGDQNMRAISWLLLHDARETESLLHKLFAARRRVGEWFALTDRGADALAMHIGCPALWAGDANA